MTEHGPGRLGVFALAIAGSLLCLGLWIVLFDPLPAISDVFSVARIRWELPRAVERWKSHGPSDYRVNVKGAVPLACFLDGELTVRDGLLVGVRMRANPLVPYSPLVDVDPGKWGDQFCAYNDLTVEGMLARVRRGVEHMGAFGAPLRVEFDAERGYITSYHFGRASQGGVFGYSVSECCTWFEFSDLTALDP